MITPETACGKIIIPNLSWMSEECKDQHTSQSSCIWSMNIHVALCNAKPPSIYNPPLRRLCQFQHTHTHTNSCFGIPNCIATTLCIILLVALVCVHHKQGLIQGGWIGWLATPPCTLLALFSCLITFYIIYKRSTGKQACQPPQQ